MTYKDYMAPMEGITNHIYRKAYQEFYHSMDKYFTPFLAAKQNKRLSAKEIREVSPETNEGLTVIPQILGNNAEDFIQLAKILRDEYSHKEINLNLGCPSGTVTAKGKGAGFLGEPEKLDAFLDSVYSSLDMEISIKTRVGTDYEEDWEYLMDIYEKYPIKELIIHPRLLKDHYKGKPRLELFRQGKERFSMPVGYNGNLFTKEDYKNFTEQFPQTEIFMFGRGIIANPGLLDEIRDGKVPDKKKLRAFHDRIYSQYQEILSGERNVLFRMKELWNYMAPEFSNYEKPAKKIKKSQNFSDYEAAVNLLFAQEWKPNGAGADRY